MTFPTLGTPGTVADTGVDVTSHNITLPSGLVTGRLLIMVIACDGVPTLTIPTYWTQILNVTSGGAVTAYVGYGFVDSNENNDLTFETSVGELASTSVWQVTDAHPSAAPEVASTSATTASPDAPSVTPTWGSDDTLWLWLCCSDGGADDVTAAPTNYGSLSNIGTSAGGANLGSATRDLAASSEDPAAGTLAISQQLVAALVAIRPVAAVSETLLFPMVFPGLRRR